MARQRRLAGFRNAVGRAQALLDSVPAIDFGRSELGDVLERVRAIQEEIDLYEDEWEE